MTKPAATNTHFAVAPNGDVVSQTEEQAIAGQANGYTPTDGDTYRQQLKAAADQKYVDENWGTAGKAAMGAASGLTLGLAPSFASRMGLVDRGHLEAAEQSGAYTAGDVAGMVAPAVLSGGESLAARGLAEGGAGGLGKIALALSPAGVMGEAGGLADRLAGRFLGESGIMGKLASPTIRMAARGATEGAINNLAHTTADAVIVNKPLTAEALLMSGADGALFGGAMGGLLGGASALAGAGVDMAGGRMAGLGAGRGGEESAAKALKYLGASDDKLAEFANRESGLVGTARSLKDVLDKGEGSISAGVGDVNRAAKQAEAGYSATVKDSLVEMQKDHPNLVPQQARVGARMDTELTAQFGSGYDAVDMMDMNRRIQTRLKNVTSWKGWAETRDSIANKMEATADPLRKGVYKTTLNIIDDEMAGTSSSLRAADSELADKYGASVVGRNQAQEFVDLTAKKAVAPEPSALNVHGAAGTIAYAAIAGANPLVGAGIIAAKQMVSRVQQKLAAPMAEAAFRSALGGQAAHATVSVGNRISSGIRAFLNGTRVAASGEHAETHDVSSKPSYTMASYKDAMQKADELTSLAHQQKVREVTQALAQQGHPELAQEMAETYGRAVAYVQKNKPKGNGPAQAAGKLGKTPEKMGLSTGDMKFIRQMHTLTKPLASIVGGLERGDISRDAVATWQNVFPAQAADLNMRVAQEVVDYRNEGKYLPADKIAMLGTVLNYPVDSKLNPDFIDAVQAGLAANKAPPPEPNAPQPQQTDVSSYQTPLQASV